MEAISRTAWNNNEVSIKATKESKDWRERREKAVPFAKEKKLMCKRNSDYVPAFSRISYSSCAPTFMSIQARNCSATSTTGHDLHTFLYIYYLFFILIFINSRSSLSSVGSDSFSRGAARMYNNCLHAMQIREGYLPWVSRPNVDYLTWIN